MPPFAGTALEVEALVQFLSWNHQDNPDTIFPFGFPLATAFYLTLFVVTLVLHVLFMNFVLAGTAWLAWSIVTGRVRLGAKSAEIAKNEPATCESILPIGFLRCYPVQ